jgi:uncharacterized membrane protein (DUF485 family)
MGNLLFNTLLYEHLKLKIKLILSMLPFSMMISSPFLILLLEEVYSGLMDEFGFSIIAVFMLVGFWIGWNLNRLIALRFLGWNAIKVNNVFSKSEVPIDWYNKNGFIDYKLKQEERFSEDIEQKTGLYILLKTSLTFYVMLNLLIVFVNPFLDGRAITNWSFILWPSPLYSMLIGLLILGAHKFSVYKDNKEKLYYEGTTYFDVGKSQSEDVFTTAGTDRVNRFLAKGSLIFGGLLGAFVFILAFIIIKDVLYEPIFDVPNKDELLEFSGYADSVGNNEDSISFVLHPSNQSFFYPKKAGAYDLVFESLKKAENKEISVLFANNDKYQTVYELKTEKKYIRTYEESNRAIVIWQAISLLIGSMLLFFSPFMIYGSWLEYKAN